jgi:spore maturation protein CgeB
VRVLIVDTCYPAFLRTHYSRRPELEAQPYATQWRALMDTFFGTADAYSHNLRELGHEAHEIVVNSGPMQAAWANEHRLRAGPDSSEEAVLLAQARDFAPDVVFVQHVHYLSDQTLYQLRQLSRLLVGQIATEPPGLERLRRFDLLITCLPSFVDRFEAAGIRSALLRLAFDSRVLSVLSADGQSHRRHGAVFVGSLGRTQHRRSNGALAKAARKVPIEFWGYGGRLWTPWSPVKRRYRGEAWGIDMYRVLRDSLLAVNRHGSIAGGFAVNMRLFEATGVGTLLVTDNGRQLGQLFEPGLEAVSYSGPSDLAESVRYYLEHEHERQAIAAAGQARTLRDHTYAQRMQELAAILEDALL